MLIEYVTHASLSLKSNGFHLLTDPFYFFDDLIASFLCHFPPRAITPQQFGRIDAVTLSHCHDDHCHRKTLQALQDRIGTIFLPAGQQGFDAKIRGYGFSNIRTLENEMTVEIGGGFRLTAFHDANGVDTALVVEQGGVTVLHQNDCRLDLPTFARMAKRFKIDYAFFPHTGNQELYPLLLPRPERELAAMALSREEAGTAYFLECLVILKPRVVIPYSFTVFYHNEDQIALNGFNRTTPREFARKIVARLPRQEVLILKPGDQIDTASGRVEEASPEDLWGGDLAAYIRNGAAYARRKFGLGRRFIFGEPGEVEADLHHYMKRRMARPFPARLAREVVALHVQGEVDTRTYYVDALGKTFGSKPGRAPLLEITIPASAVRAFLSRLYDAFMILYSYRIRFLFHGGGLFPMTDSEECDFYIQSILAIFQE